MVVEELEGKFASGSHMRQLLEVQSHITGMMADVSTASTKASPMVGNLSDMMPRSTQAPLLKKNMSEQSVIYVI